eukprot:CAMPEP_0202963846 /NCGR_PEP_ID=MMETSP1396-20130829/7883_1 /ASSEMBLY_ACC=CAM_ASM_000872 /TAXON_ID= /ORGANISM="Pseudokeronopsis sp., Strain Brazil" /LENGTH=155 /DNA_ID=CAMNT_0049685427 /DNA_START=78 /DNA_END=545 /DNA_ORIENTATION=-
MDDTSVCCGTERCYTNYTQTATECYSSYYSGSWYVIDGVGCNYYCPTSGQFCAYDSDCSYLGENYCCAILQSSQDNDFEPAQCVICDLNGLEVYYDEEAYYAYTISTMESQCVQSYDCLHYTLSNGGQEFCCATIDISYNENSRSFYGCSPNSYD